MRIYIAYPNMTFPEAERALFRLKTWLVASKLTGDPEIKGALIKPRYRQRYLNLESISDNLKVQPFWRCGCWIEFLSVDARRYFNDLDLPPDAEIM